MTEFTNASGLGGNSRNESGSWEPSADFLDDRVRVRSPYTGQLDSPNIVGDYGDLTSSRNSCPTRRSNFSDASAPAVVDTDDDPQSTVLGRFRIAAAGFAIMAGIGVAAFAVMGARQAPAVEAKSAGEQMASPSGQKTEAEAVVAPEDEPEANDTLTSLKSPILLGAAVEDAEKASPEEAENSTTAKAPDAEGDLEENEKSVSVQAPPPETVSDSQPVEEGTVAEAVGAVADSPVAYEALLAKAKSARGGKARIGLLREAIGVNPRGDEALAELALLLMELPKTRKEALDLAERAAAVNSQNATAWLVVGYVRQLEGNMVEARKAYAQCAQAQGPKKYVRECRGLM